MKRELREAAEELAALLAQRVNELDYVTMERDELRAQLATAVEALEWYASEIRWPAYSERACEALAAIHGRGTR